MRAVLSSAAALAVAWSVFAVTHASGDAPMRIAVGETGSRVGGLEVASSLESAITRGLRGLPDVQLAADSRRARYVVRGSVVTLERRAVSDGLEVRCAVSLIVSDNRGSIVALLDGNAGARGIDDADRLALAAIDGAVRGALRPLEDRLR